MEPYMCMVSHSEMSNSLRPPWTVVHQTLLSMGFSRQEYWNGLPFSTPEDLPDPGIEPASLSSPALAGAFFTASMLLPLPPPSQGNNNALFLAVLGQTLHIFLE